MNQEFSSPGASDPANYAPWASSDSPPSSYMPSSPGSYSSPDSASSSSSSSSSSTSSSSGSFFGRGPPFMGSSFPTSSSGFPGFPGNFPGSYPGSSSFPGASSFSGRFSGDFSRGPSKPSDGPGGFNSDEGPAFTGIQGEIIDEDNPPNVFDYKPPRGKDINDLPHILPPGGKSIEQLQEEADFRLKKLFFEAKVNQKSVQEKINKLKENYGYGTFGFDGYKSPIKYGPINLGSHNAIDLGTSIDYNRLKGHPGKLKLPVQTVTVTKTLGIHVPHPYPVKQEVPVPAPYPVIQHVPAPHHDHHQYGGGSSSYQPNHDIIEQYSGTYSSEYPGSGGKSSYPGPPQSISKLVRYHENLPRGPVKSFPSSYKGSATSYSSFQPSKSFPSIGHSSSPNHYLMPPSPGSRSYGYDSHHYSS